MKRLKVLPGSLSVVDSVLYLERTVLISKKSILIDGFLFGSYALGNP